MKATRGNHKPAFSVRHYCTYFDRFYLGQGLTLYRSLLAASAGPFILHVLCFDDETFDVLTRLGRADLKPVSLREFEDGDAALLEAKKTRNRVEYYFTCSPSWLLYLLNRYPETDIITYLDADLMFHSPPGPIFDELGDGDVLIVGHRFPERFRKLEAYGIYNVGLISFRNSPSGRKALGWWRDRCLEWCHDRVEEGRFADQKYLDDWPERFEGVVVLRHPGAGLAPWNLMNHAIAPGKGAPTVDGRPLVFFHYHGVKVIRRYLYDLGKDHGPISRLNRRTVYQPYVRALKETERWLQKRVPGTTVEYAHPRLKKYGVGGLIKRLYRGQFLFDLV